MFGSSVSIASLSNNIIKWRGFIHDTLLLYREAVRDPVQDALARAVDFRISDSTVDVLVSFLIFFGACLRGLHVIFLIEAGRIIILVFVTGFSIHVLSGGAFSGNVAGSPEDWIRVGMLIAMGAVLSYALVEVLAFSEQDPLLSAESRRKTVVLLFHLASIVLVVLLMAGISLGFAADINTRNRAGDA